MAPTSASTRTRSGENYQDFYIQNDTTLDVAYGTRLNTGLLYRHAHTPRTSSDDLAGSAEPLMFNQGIFSLGFERDLSIFTLGVNGAVDRITYLDSKAIGGGTIDNSDRDRTQSNVAVGLGYVPLPGVNSLSRYRVSGGQI